MGKMATIDTETQNKNISINEIILKLTKKPMDIEDFESIGRYFNALKQANLIDLVGLVHFYDKQMYDFYFILEDSSTGVAKKVITKKTMVDLIIKYDVIGYIVANDYIKDHPTIIKQ